MGLFSFFSSDIYLYYNQLEHFDHRQVELLNPAHFVIMQCPARPIMHPVMHVHVILAKFVCLSFFY